MPNITSPSPQPEVGKVDKKPVKPDLKPDVKPDLKPTLGMDEGIKGGRSEDKAGESDGWMPGRLRSPFTPLINLLG
jgi:hypothetical protein